MKLHLGDFSGQEMCEGAIVAPNELVAFTDSSWGHGKPASGYAVFFLGALVS